MTPAFMTTVKVTDAFRNRWGLVGVALAASLPFSFDIIGVIAQYTFVQPELLRLFAIRRPGNGRHIGMQPFTPLFVAANSANEVVVSDGWRMRVYKDEKRCHNEMVVRYCTQLSGLFVDAQDNIVVVDPQTRQLLIADWLSGKITKVIQAPPPASGGKMGCVTGHPDTGALFVCDTVRVLVFDSKGEYLRHFGNHELKGARCCAVNKSGVCYVGDQAGHNAVVRMYDGDGHYLGQFGSDQFGSVDHIAIFNAGNLVVCDNKLNRLSIFSANGEFVYSLYCPGVRCAFVRGGEIFATGEPDYVAVFSQ